MCAYTTLANLHPWNRAKVDPIQLLLLCKEKDVAYFGYPRVLEPVLMELKDLEDNGISIRGNVVKVVVLVILGDNLGTQFFCGFTENFSTSKYFCRYCEEPRDEWRKRWDQNVSSNCDEDSSDTSDSDSDSDNRSTDDKQVQEVPEAEVNDSSDDDDEPLAFLIPLANLSRQLHRNKAPIRTPQSFDACVEQLAEQPDGVKGVVGGCDFNKLKHYHVIGRTPPCLPHDVLEGVVPYDILLFIKHFMKQYKFSFDILNRLISSFEFQGTEKLDKPPPKFHAGRKKVRGSAFQNWTLLRFLPAILDRKVVDKSDPVWTLLLCLVELVSLIASPVISESVLPYVETLIYK